jgi:ABC-type sugar transport system permease subunit
VVVRVLPAAARARRLDVAEQVAAAGVARRSTRPGNYEKIADNSLVADAVLFTLKYTAVVTMLLFAISFGLALLIQNAGRGVGFFRGAFFLPAAVGWATATLLFFGLLSDQIGPLNGHAPGGRPDRRARVLDRG